MLKQCPRLQRRERVAAEPGVVGGDILECPIERELALEPERQRFEAGEPSEGRVRPLREREASAVQLLGEPGGHLLERAFLAPEPREDRHEPFLLLGHLGVQPAKLLFERQPALMIGQRLHQLQRGDRAGEMVLQVARQRIGRHQGSADQGAQGARSPRAILSVVMN